MKYPRILAAIVGLGPAIISSGAEQPLPLFSGFIASPSTGTQFVMKWKSPNGTTLQSWLRVGAKTSEFQIIAFDPETEILTIEDQVGRRHELSMPESRVQSDQLTDSEFSALSRYLYQGADTRDAPVLSRSKARAFYLRWIAQSSTSEIEVIFDPHGDTLPPAVRATWGEDKIRARTHRHLRLAVIVNGATKIHEFPLHPHPVPEQMTRNLLDSDWDEIGMLDATNTLKRWIARLSSERQKA